MDIILQNKIRQDLNNLRYLREKSYWYKYLNRSSAYYKAFNDEMKKSYKITTIDKIQRISNGIDEVSKIIDILS